MSLEIEVPEDLPESHVHELLRLQVADFAHGQDHKKNPQLGMDSCWFCKLYRSAMRSIAEGNTSEMIEKIEVTARKLCDQYMSASSIEMDPKEFWEDLLSERGRLSFRRRAYEIIEALELPLPIAPHGAKV